MSDRRYTYLAGEDILLLKRRYTALLEKTHRLWMNSGMAGFLLLLFTLTACVGEELQKPLLGEGEGYLTLQVGAISAEVTSDPLTKATLENLPDPTEFSITIKDANNTVVKQYEKLSQIENPLVLKAGVTYTVEASHGKNEALQDTPYFSGSEEVTIQANTNNPVTVTATLKNAMIIPVVTDSLKNHYKNDWILTASVGETSLLLASAEAGIDTLYAHADSIVSLTFTGTNKADQNVSFKWTATEAVKASKAYTVECKPDLAAFYKIEVKATANHTTDGDGNLNGTDVTFNADINDEYKAAIDSFKVQVFNSNQQVIRTYTGTSLSNMKCENNDWPYIPQGSSLSASVKLKAGDEIALTNATIEVPEPTFSVKASAYTSYNKYTSEDIDGANACDGSTIYDMQAVPTISEELLKNSNYSKSSTLTLDDNSVDPGDASSQSWAAHTLVATYTFDGVPESGSEIYHVTGLPYDISLKDNSNPSGWDLNNCGSNYTRLTLKRGEAYALTIEHYIPNTINVRATLTAYAYGGSLANSPLWGSPYKPTVSISASVTGVQGTPITTLEGTNTLSYANDAPYKDILSNCVLVPSINRICIYTSGTGHKSSVGSGDMGVVCKQFKIEYR